MATKSILRSCQKCSKEFLAYPFTVKKGFGKFCSLPCKNAHWKGIRRVENHSKPCIACGKIMFRNGGKHAQWAKKTACSRKCAGKAKAGKHIGGNFTKVGRVTSLNLKRDDLFASPPLFRKDYQFRLKMEAFNRYGGPRCVCCGEDLIGFLTLDHINGDGNKWRREDPRSIKQYSWLRDKGYPEGFQVLCYNCNCGRDKNGGICPHEDINLAMVG